MRSVYQRLALLSIVSNGLDISLTFCVLLRLIDLVGGADSMRFQDRQFLEDENVIRFSSGISVRFFYVDFIRRNSLMKSRFMNLVVNGETGY